MVRCAAQENGTGVEEFGRKGANKTSFWVIELTDGTFQMMKNILGEDGIFAGDQQGDYGERMAFRSGERKKL